MVIKFAPVLIPTLCRYEHFKRCVESLALCTHAQETDLYVALDYPAKDLHWDGYVKIKNFLSTLKDFKSVNIFERKKNYGVICNMLSARADLFKKYDRLIYTEDDNEFSPNFLDYINKGLVEFENDKRVYAICGYKFLQDNQLSLPGGFCPCNLFSAYGYGILRNTYNKYFEEFTSLDSLLVLLKQTKSMLKVFKYRHSYLSLLLELIKTKLIWNDLAISVHLITLNMYVIMPEISLVRNHGHDGSGTVSGMENNKGEFCYSTQEIDTRSTFEFGCSPDVKTVNLFADSIMESVQYGVVHKTWTLFRYFVYRVSGRIICLNDSMHKIAGFFCRAR